MTLLEQRLEANLGENTLETSIRHQMKKAREKGDSGPSERMEGGGGFRRKSPFSTSPSGASAPTQAVTSTRQHPDVLGRISERLDASIESTSDSLDGGQGSQHAPPPHSTLPLAPARASMAGSSPQTERPESSLSSSHLDIGTAATETSPPGAAATASALGGANLLSQEALAAAGIDPATAAALLARQDPQLLRLQQHLSSQQQSRDALLREHLLQQQLAALSGGGGASAAVAALGGAGASLGGAGVLGNALNSLQQSIGGAGGSSLQSQLLLSAARGGVGAGAVLNSPQLQLQQALFDGGVGAGNNHAALLAALQQRSPHGNSVAASLLGAGGLDALASTGSLLQGELGVSANSAAVSAGAPSPSAPPVQIEAPSPNEAVRSAPIDASSMPVETRKDDHATGAMGTSSDGVDADTEEEEEAEDGGEADDAGDDTGSGAPDDASSSSLKRKPRGGVAEPFPRKLHRMLAELESENKDDIISFFPHGRAFAIHKPRQFISEVMPRYFRMSRLSSFQRQLNLYGFKRITEGRDKSGYYHELFLRGRPGLCNLLKRTKAKNKQNRAGFDDSRSMLWGGASGLASSLAGGAVDYSSEPNFYEMPPIPDPSQADDATLVAMAAATRGGVGRRPTAVDIMSRLAQASGSSFGGDLSATAAMLRAGAAGGLFQGTDPTATLLGAAGAAAPYLQAASPLQEAAALRERLLRGGAGGDLGVAAGSSGIPSSNIAFGPAAALALLEQQHQQQRLWGGASAALGGSRHPGGGGEASSSGEGGSDDAVARALAAAARNARL